MRYDQDDRESSNIEDRRGQGGRFPFPGGGDGMRIPIGRGGFSVTTLLFIGAVMLLMGINPLDVLLRSGSDGQVSMPDLPGNSRTVARGPGADSGYPGSGSSGGGQTMSEDQAKVFVSRVLADTEDVWTRVFKSFGRQYHDPALVLFSGYTRTACGAGQAAMGPFYCPLDQKVYIDLSFFDEMRRKFNISGDFAEAYVIAHEVGHHVQNELGIAEKVQELKSRSDERTANAIQVRMELQADCFAGVWAHLNDKLKSRLQPGDVDEALNAAHQIGDDMIQRRMTGRVVPDSFTHGSAEQRARWFKAGLATGQLQSCDTFNASNL